MRRIVLVILAVVVIANQTAARRPDPALAARALHQAQTALDALEALAMSPTMTIACRQSIDAAMDSARTAAERTRRQFREDIPAILAAEDAYIAAARICVGDAMMVCRIRIAPACEPVRALREKDLLPR